MRLPIYRRLDERLKIFGLSLMELSVVGGTYVVLAEALSFVRFGMLFALVVALVMFGILLYFHRKYESHFLQKWIRYVQLPEGLTRSTSPNWSRE